jgi:hypothetical protein
MNWARIGGTAARVGFELTVLRSEWTGKLSDVRCQRVGPGPLPLSLSSDYKEENAGRNFLLFAVFPIAEVSYRHPLTSG